MWLGVPSPRQLIVAFSLSKSAFRIVKETQGARKEVWSAELVLALGVSQFTGGVDVSTAAQCRALNETNIGSLKDGLRTAIARKGGEVAEKLAPDGYGVA